MSERRWTPGPWAIWADRTEYVGGGEDLCIGAGEKWLANMDHRSPRCPQIHDDGHFDNDACDICTIDAPRITDEQRANARLIAAAPDLYEALAALADDYARLCGDGMTEYTEPAVLTQARAALSRADATPKEG